MMNAEQTAVEQTEPPEPSEQHEADVCIVGGGPAGVVLAYLLSRAGLTVTLLEAQKDFDREFRGDTLHAAIMEHMDELGLADRLLQQTHYRLGKISLRDSRDMDKGVPIVDFSHLKTKFPFVTMMAQPIFLSFMVAEAEHYDGFNLLMGTAAQELVTEGGRVVGVEYQRRTDDRQRIRGEVRASLVVAADGRSSRLRKLAGLKPEPITEPMDVFWFRLPKTPADADAEMSGLMGGGRLPFISLEREDHWQCGLVFPHGGYKMMKEKGMDVLRGYVAEAAPQLADRLETHLTEWQDLAWLTVAGARLKQWWQPGLLFIGDAAHVMTPLGGVGINYAIQDAIEAANVLVQPLRDNAPTDQQVANQYLAAVQKRREWPTRVIQSVQAAAQKRILAPGLLLNEPFELPPFLRALPHIPFLRRLPSRMIGIGAKRVKIDPILLG